ncbi:MAG: EAL domain-containing protein [Gammaproteobacteria bacterium]|nr:EAL domain-containing protein [Gammaproteobacteria bacterium]
MSSPLIPESKIAVGERDESLLKLSRRIDFLEDENRWHMYSLDLMASMCNVFASTRHNNNANEIYTDAWEFIQQAIYFQYGAFLTIADESAEFEIAWYSEQCDSAALSVEITHQIEQGQFSWALNQNRAVLMQSRNNESTLTFHALSMSGEIKGMFVAGMPNGANKASPSACGLLSIILGNCCYAIENSALYRLVHEQNKSLEATIVKRTKELQDQYCHDALTGLPNRLLFEDRLELAKNRAKRNHKMVAIFILDLDMFKRINDSLGHQVGDKLLTVMANRLSTCLRDSDTVTRIGDSGESPSVLRLGGDEFSVIISDIEDIDAVITVANRITSELSRCFVINDHEVCMTSSIGIALYPEDGEDTETLLKNADLAMYSAKNQGRNNFQFYSSGMNSKALQHLRLETHLRSALEKQEFVLHYQPQVDAVSGKISGVEALIRWISESEGFVSPADFIPIAEDIGMIIPIGEWVLWEACRQMSEWHKQGHMVRVAVNLSACQLRDPNFVVVVDTILSETGANPSYLELELTESIIIGDVDATMEMMAVLRERGIRIAIDDFGTGYSSLNYLKRFPIHCLKIDRSFINDVTLNQDDAAIVKTIIAMAHTMKLDVVAEGVESKDQLAFLRGEACDQIQGFYFSKPLPSNEVIKLLRVGWLCS